MLQTVLAKLKYPKFLLLIITFVLAYLLFKEADLTGLNKILLSLGYFGTFLAGLFFVYGFTAAFGTAILLIIAPDQNILLAGLIAGLGALTGDLIIFKSIRYSLKDELKKLAEQKIFVYFNNKAPYIIKKYLIPIIACIIIALPLPDEIGVSLIASSSSISTKTFTILSFLLNTAGIFVILLIGSKIG
jgi:uncharacterized membrane protein YdjX (TVP38/TMEM64 family)